jgi:hypothetical protein
MRCKRRESCAPALISKCRWAKQYGNFAVHPFLYSCSLSLLYRQDAPDRSSEYDQFDHSNAMPFVCALRGFHVYNKLTKTYSTHAERNLKKKKRKWKKKQKTKKQDKLLLVCLEFSLYFIYNPSAFVIARTAPNSFSWYIFISRG